MAWIIRFGGQGINKKRFEHIRVGDSGWITAWDKEDNDRTRVTKYPAHQIKKIQKVE